MTVCFSQRKKITSRQLLTTQFPKGVVIKPDNITIQTISPVKNISTSVKKCQKSENFLSENKLISF